MTEEEQWAYEEANTPLADLPGGILDRDAFRTIIPPSAEDVDPKTGKPYGRLTPEELDKLREDSFKRRMQRGVEYNPFRVARELPTTPANRTTGSSPQSPEAMIPEPDMGPPRDRMMPDATVVPFTPEQRVEAQKRAEQQRVALEKYIDKNKERLPEKLRKDIMLLLAFEKRIIENLSLTESERHEKLQEMREKREGVKKSLMGAADRGTEGKDRASSEEALSQAEIESEVNRMAAEGGRNAIKGLPEIHDVKPRQFGPRRDKENDLSLTGAIFAATIAAIIMFGLAWPGFKGYFFDPIQEKLTGKVDKNKIV